MKLRKSNSRSTHKRSTTKKRRIHTKKTRRTLLKKRTLRKRTLRKGKYIKKQRKMRGGEQEGDTFYFYKNNRNEVKHIELIKGDWENDDIYVKDEDGNETKYNIYDWKQYKLNYKYNSGFPQIANDVVEDEMDIESDYEDMEQM